MTENEVYEVVMLFEISSIFARRILVQSAPDFISLLNFGVSWNRWFTLLAVGSACSSLAQFSILGVAFSTASGNFAGDAVATITLGVLNQKYGYYYLLKYWDSFIVEIVTACFLITYFISLLLCISFIFVMVHHSDCSMRAN